MQQLLYLLGGLSFLFLGMERLSRGLSGLFAPQTKKIDVLGGFLTGLFWTAAVQSSSAVTACLVSMSQVGIFTVIDCFPILMGANVGTTLTVWLMSGLHAVTLRGIGLLPAILALLLKKRRTASEALLGLSLVLLGMELMQMAAAPVRNMPMVIQSPWAAFASGVLATAVIQSSAVVIGTLQEMGGLTMRLAIPAIVGANIGTCATGLLAAAMLGRTGRQTALLNLAINLAAALFILPLLPLLPDLPATPVRIAAAHSFLNAWTAAILLPAVPFLHRRINVKRQKCSPAN